MRAVLLGVLLTGSLSGCGAYYTKSLQRESARGINPHPYPDSVTVSNVHGTSWVATTSSGVYDCSQQSGEDVALCVKRQTPR